MSPSINSFGLSLAKEICDKKPGQNLLLSAPGIYSVLAMAWAGARGETRAALEKALGIHGDSFSKDMRPLLQGYQHGESAKSFRQAQALWTNPANPLKPDYLHAMRRDFLSEVFFTPPKDAAFKLNAWAKEKTEGKIPSILDKVDDQTALILLSGAYFHGLWHNAFEEKYTDSDVFHIPGGRDREIPFMHDSGNYPYYADPQFQAVCLEYKDPRFGLYVLLPKESTNVMDLLKNREQGGLSDLPSRLQAREGHISLPRFSLEFSGDLITPLKAMGLGALFDQDRADLRGMTHDPRGLYVDKAAQVAFLKVDEHGTEAAAVTYHGPVPCGIDPNVFYMTMDRPFLCFIYDQETRLILFLAVVQDPQ